MKAISPTAPNELIEALRELVKEVEANIPHVNHDDEYCIRCEISGLSRFGI